jgi:hypothetical protein
VQLLNLRFGLRCAALACASGCDDDSVRTVNGYQSGAVGAALQGAGSKERAPRSGFGRGRDTWGGKGDWN